MTVVCNAPVHCAHLCIREASNLLGTPRRLLSNLWRDVLFPDFCGQSEKQLELLSTSLEAIHLHSAFLADRLDALEREELLVEEVHACCPGLHACVHTPARFLRSETALSKTWISIDLNCVDNRFQG
jgi:hypothetical protein